MNDGSRIPNPRRSAGRPIAQDPRSEHLAIRLTRSEYQVLLERAGKTTLSTYGRQTLLQEGQPTGRERTDIEENWRTLDALTEDLFRIGEALKAQQRLDDDPLLLLIAQVQPVLDDLRVLLTSSGSLS